MLYLFINTSLSVKFVEYNQDFIQDFQLGGDDVPVIKKSHLGGSGGMLPQKNLEF